MVNANNIAIANSSVSGQNTAAHTQLINFDISWENSWRISNNQNNYDGAWVFVKFRKTGTYDWRHCTISPNGFTAGTGSTITVSSDSIGAFIYRNASNQGTGNVSFLANKLLWNYGADGVFDNETVEIKVFAVEMVFIPAGSFYAGSGGTETNAFQNGTSGSPFLITANTITFGSAANNLNVRAGTLPAGILPASFPRGTEAFWIMKYECTQQQYIDFINLLDNARATVNMPETIVLSGEYPAYIAPNPERVIGDLTYKKIAAYADWCGLRPYSELEFEKVCRGAGVAPLPNEYPWANTTINGLLTLADTGLNTERVATPPNANVVMWVGGPYYRAPVRAGLFARPSASTRELSGAAYYGVMNMADNMLEIVASATKSAGLAINKNVHGNGVLNLNGESDIAEWNNSDFFMSRGSAYSNGTYNMARTSDRADYNHNIISYNGIRLARSF